MGGHHHQHTETTHQDNSFRPPDWALPLYKHFTDDLSNMYNKHENGSTNDLSDITKDAIKNMGSLVNQYNNSYLNNMHSSSSQNLNDIAQGKQIGHNNAFNDALQNTLSKTADNINLQFSGAGRYGSGANNSVLSNSLGQLASNATAQQYNQDINNMFNANRQIYNSNSQKMNDYNNWLHGKSDALQRLLNGGNIIDQHNQEKNNEGINRLNSYADILRKLSGNYCDNSTTTTNKQPNNWLKTIGGPLSIFGSLMGGMK